MSKKRSRSNVQSHIEPPRRPFSKEKHRRHILFLASASLTSPEMKRGAIPSMASRLSLPFVRTTVSNHDTHAHLSSPIAITNQQTIAIVSPRVSAPTPRPTRTQVYDFQLTICMSITCYRVMMMMMMTAHRSDFQNISQ